MDSFIYQRSAALLTGDRLSHLWNVHRIHCNGYTAEGQQQPANILYKCKQYMAIQYIGSLQKKKIGLNELQPLWQIWMLLSTGRKTTTLIQNVNATSYLFTYQEF